MKIYVASSWRNPIQPKVVNQLKEHTQLQVYDFRTASDGGARGFHWREIDPNWEKWTVGQYKDALVHELAAKGYAADINNLDSAGATLLVLPCGKSSHLELGFAQGAKQKTAIYMPVDILGDDFTVEPELMYKMVDHIFAHMDGVITWAQALDKGGQ